jgi:hypothetical protein
MSNHEVSVENKLDDIRVLLREIRDHLSDLNKYIAYAHSQKVSVEQLVK